MFQARNLFHKLFWFAGIGDLLIKHPLAIAFLLRNMFGTKRIRQLETRQKCARLLALSVIASERISHSENKANASTSDEDVLWKVSACKLDSQ